MSAFTTPVARRLFKIAGCQIMSSAATVAELHFLTRLPQSSQIYAFLRAKGSTSLEILGALIR